MTNKYCKKCNQTKNTDEFRARVRPKQLKNGSISFCHTLYHECKECERLLKTSPTAKIRKYVLLDKQKGLSTTITETWYTEYILNKPCSYCGLTHDSMVADRIDNSLGHTPGNCIPACPLCNMTRSNKFSVNEMKLLGPSIREIIEARREP